MNSQAQKTHFLSLIKTFALMLLTACPVWAETNKAQSGERPNIVLIMVDDMGFSDIGCYGGEIDTPHLDRLAADGLRFTRFYNAGRCCPTRASLLTGLYQHQAGIGHMIRDYGWDAYRGRLSNRSVTLAEALKGAGYATAMTGKWHVGLEPDVLPPARGFDRFYGTPEGGSHHHKMIRDRRLMLDEQVIEVPEGWYSTTGVTDYSLQFIDEAQQDDSPLFLYVSYLAPHWPLHAPKETIAKFEARYAKGWRAVREERWNRQKEMGLFPEGTKLSPVDPRIPTWESVDRDEMALRMATHAAMVHLVDEGVGQIVDRLREHGQLDNTLILFLSDNGASAERGSKGFTGKRGGDPKARTGTPTSYNSFGISGANVSDTPFRLYKKYMHEGGIATPLIAHWPNGIDQSMRGGWSREAGHVIDFMPTFLELASGTYPEERGGVETIPVEGRSLVPALSGESIHRPEGLYFEHEGCAAVLIGNWKLVREHNKPWELYNLAEDRTELSNLVEKHPKRAGELESKWKQWADRVGVRPYPVKPKQ